MRMHFLLRGSAWLVSGLVSVAAVAAGRTPTYVVNRDVLQQPQLRSRLLDQHQ